MWATNNHFQDPNKELISNLEIETSEITAKHKGTFMTLITSKLQVLRSERYLESNSTRELKTLQKRCLKHLFTFAFMSAFFPTSTSAILR
jgi:hypothetical protein